MPSDSRSDHAPAEDALKAIYGAFGNAVRELAANVGEVARVSKAGIEFIATTRFTKDANGKTIPLLDTDERGAQPARFTVEVEGLPQKPTLGETK